MVESVAAVVFPAIMRMVISLLYARWVLFELLERRKVGKKRALASWQAIQQGKDATTKHEFFSLLVGGVLLFVTTTIGSFVFLGAKRRGQSFIGVLVSFYSLPPSLCARKDEDTL